MTAITVRCVDAECARTLEDIAERVQTGAHLQTSSPIIIWDGSAPWQEPQTLPAALITLGKAYDTPPHPAQRHYQYLLPIRAEEFSRKLHEIIKSTMQEGPLHLPTPLQYDARQRVLSRSDSGAKEELTELESRLFEALMAEEGKMLARSTLLSSVWGYAENVETRTLEAHIYRLRQKLESLQGGLDTGVEILTHEDGYEAKIIG